MVFAGGDHRKTRWLQTQKVRHPLRLKGLHSEQRRREHMQADPFAGRLLPQSSAGGSHGTRAKIARASNSGNCRDC